MGVLLLVTIIVAFFILLHAPSSKLQNCVWLSSRTSGLDLMNNPSLWQTTAVKLEHANIYCIIVWAGNWNSDHTINYDDSPSVWTQFISTTKAVNSNFKILALVNGWGVNISEPNYRTTMLNSVKHLLTSVSFDGLNDDLENFTGTNQNLINYWQAEASLVKGMGKIATVDLGVDLSYKIEDVYPYLTNFNYIMPMFYSTIEDANALINWNRILSNSPTKVIMGIDVDPQDMNNFSISQQFNWLDQTLKNSQHSNLAGFSIWAYDYWSDSDFAAWSNWSAKNTIGSP